MAKVERPDSPRSWAICFAACVINTMLSGISRTTGLFYVAFIDTYGITRLQANLPFTMRNIIRNITGPLVGAIGQKYGAQDITIAGEIFSSLGILLCAFVSDITWITVLWGVLHGLGVALANILCQVVATQYFFKYRATASGLAVSGACLGAVFFPFIIEYSLLHFGLSGTFLITGALILHCLPASILIKEPYWIRKDTKSEKLKDQSCKSSKRLKSLCNETTNIVIEEINVSSLQAVTAPKELMTITAESDKIQIAKSTRNIEKMLNEEGIDNHSFMASQLDLKMVENERNKYYNLKTAAKGIEMAHQGTEQVKNSHAKGSIQTVSHSTVNSTKLDESPNQLQETSIYKAIAKVCRDPMFHMISISMAAFAMVVDPALTIIVDYLIDKGLKEDIANYFISLMALADLFGRMCLGWVVDKNYMSVPRFMMLVQLIQGISVLLMPLFYSFNTLLIIIVIFGVSSGAITIMFPILIGKYLQSVQSMAIGSIQFLSGILSFAVPPLIGYFRDDIGSYDGMLYITGAMSVIIGGLWLLEPLWLKFRYKLEDG